MNEELIAPCGMNCALCSSYLALKHDLKKQGIHRSYCAGCRPEKRQCAILKKRCGLLSDDRVRFCYQCPDYPCANLAHLDKRYRTFYRMSMLDNLDHIRTEGLEAFLIREAEKWKCPNCGGTICCHNGLCFNCRLDDLKNKKKKRYRWEDD
jgi:hypothetical protein